MNIKELVNNLKEQGLQDDEIKAELEKIKAEIDAIINPSQEAPAETDDEKMARVFKI